MSELQGKGQGMHLRDRRPDCSYPSTAAAAAAAASVTAAAEAAAENPTTGEEVIANVLAGFPWRRQ